MAIKLKAIRVVRGLKQEELAERVGVKLSTIQKIEGGKHNPTPTNAQAIAEVLGFVNWYDFYTDVTEVQWKGEAPI